VSDPAPAPTPGHLRLVGPEPGTVQASAFLIAVVLVPGALAQAVGGLNASVTVGLCTGAAMSFGTLMRARTAALVTLALGAAAAAGALVAGQPWLSGLAVTAAILLTAPANA